MRRGASNDKQKPHQAATPPSIKKAVAVDGDGNVTNGPVIRDNHNMLPLRLDSMSSSLSSGSAKQRSCMKQTISSFNKSPSPSSNYASSYYASTSTGRVSEEWGVIKQGAGTVSGAGGNNK